MKTSTGWLCLLGLLWSGAFVKVASAHTPEEGAVYSEIASEPVLSFAEEESRLKITDISILSPYIGANLKYYYAKGDTEIFNALLLNNYIGAEVFLGTWLYEFMGIEIGYGLTGKRSKGITVGKDFNIEGVQETPGQSANGRNALETAYTDLNFLWPLACDYGILASVGIGLGKPEMDLTINRVDRKPKGRYMAYVRAGLGLQQQIIEHIGFRGMIRFEGLRRMRIKVRDATGSVRPVRPLKNAISATLGVYMNFW